MCRVCLSVYAVTVYSAIIKLTVLLIVPLRAPSWGCDPSPVRLD